MKDSPENQNKTSHNNTPLLSWKAREHEHRFRNTKLYVIIIVGLFAIIIYALLSQSPIVAITFMLIGVVGYVYVQKPSPLLSFGIDSRGIRVENNLYPYENISSFWILYEPEGIQCISLHTDAELTPYVHIPLGDVDPVEAREHLIQFLPEERHPLQLIDRLIQYF